MYQPIDHSLLSPSGRVSKRAKRASDERVRRELFDDGLPFPSCRLKALNAELVEALEAIVNNDFDVLGEPTTAYTEVVRIARAALAKVRK